MALQPGSPPRTRYRARLSCAAVALVTCIAAAGLAGRWAPAPRLAVAVPGLVVSDGGDVPAWSGDDAGSDGDRDVADAIESDDEPADDAAGSDGGDGGTPVAATGGQRANESRAEEREEDGVEPAGGLSVATPHGATAVVARAPDGRRASGCPLTPSRRLSASRPPAASPHPTASPHPPATGDSSRQPSAKAPTRTPSRVSTSRAARKGAAAAAAAASRPAAATPTATVVAAATDDADADDDDDDAEAPPGGAAAAAAALSARCLAMPDPAAFRVFVAALPPSVYGGSARDDAAATLPDMIHAMWRWSQGSDRRDPYARIDVRAGARRVTEAALRAALINGAGRRDAGAAIARTGGAVLSRAVERTGPRMAALAAVEAGGTPAPAAGPPAAEYEYSTVSWRDLERVIVSGLLASPYVRVVDLRNWTADDLRAAGAAVVLVPFPLSRLRGVTSKAQQLLRVAREFVPTLWGAPGLHAFPLARIIRDMAVLRSLAHTLRPIVRTEPWRRAQYWSFEPFWAGSLPKAQRVLPYPGSVGRRPRPRGASGAGRRPPRWAPADPMHYRGAAAADRCDPLGADGSVRPPGDPAPPGCSPSDEMAPLAAERPFLVSFMGAPRGSMPERVTMFSALRACSSCAVFDVRSPVFRDGFGMPWLYAHSLFCAQPHGDSPSRKALFDALAYGCIPIVLDKRDANSRGRAPVLPFASVLPWDDLAVRVTRAEWFGAGIVAAVRRLPAARVREMQVALARHAHLLAFGLPAPPDVAVLTGARPPAPVPAGARRCAADATDMLLLALAPPPTRGRPSSKARRKRARPGRSVV